MAGVNIKGLCKTYTIHSQEVQALSNINLTIQDGSFVTLVGKSGSGKTTLLRLLCGLEQATQGEISFLSPKKERAVGKERISIVFQEPRLMPWLTVEQNMAFALFKEKDPLRVSRTVSHFLDMLGLKKFKDAYPAQISGGMAQRTSLGRTLCYDPDIILMDEPLGALDAFTRKNLQAELVEIFLLQKKTIIFVTHDVDEAVFLGQRVVIFEGGKIVEDVPVSLNYPRNPLSPDFFQIRERILGVVLGE
ncbi:ABC transporter related protein [Desulforamulus reducens MI-1]|uniref:ABC transporter related protein n=1 Tax=Desulforamulus reducens (strain ATCC BAA-1160 / DSM 100696 / MI-1) TaxID=349161 RepID=A4J4U9_DESRM|nr:ABC transporter ATP-binding protein [Desulforamulus reducens]ABO50102.1 ABC transporter related protein [Desulforamulus reducens MI-1]